jgi:hypothetical protein
MVEIECPAGGCDFEGPVESVRGHITASPSGWHDGKTGFAYQDELLDQAEARAEAEEAVPEVAEESSAEEAEAGEAEAAEGGEPEPSQVEESAVPAVEVASEPSMPTDDEYREQQAGQSEKDSEVVGDGGGGSSEDESDPGPTEMPLPGNPRTLMMLVAVLAVGWMVYTTVSSGSGGEAEPATTEPTEDSQDGSEPSVAGGLTA